MDSQSAAGSLAQAEGEELLSSRDVFRCHHLPSKSSKPRARLARVLLHRDMVVCPLSATLEEEPVGNITVSPRDRGHHGLPILSPVFTLQNNSKVSNILLPLQPPSLTRSKPHLNPPKKSCSCVRTLCEAKQGWWHLTWDPSGDSEPMVLGWGGWLWPQFVKTHPGRL